MAREARGRSIKC